MADTLQDIRDTTIPAATTQVAAAVAQLLAQVTALKERALPHGVPATATPFTAQSAVNTGAAAVALKAAVSGKRHWITEIEIVNKTAGEYPVAELTEDYAGTPAILATLVPMPVSATSMGQIVQKFSPPLVVTAGKSIGFQLQSTTGDCYARIGGYVEA